MAALMRTAMVRSAGAGFKRILPPLAAPSHHKLPSLPAPSGSTASSPLSRSAPVTGNAGRSPSGLTTETGPDRGKRTAPNSTRQGLLNPAIGPAFNSSTQTAVGSSELPLPTRSKDFGSSAVALHNRTADMPGLDPPGQPAARNVVTDKGFATPPIDGIVKVLFCGDEFPAAYDLSAELLHQHPHFKAEWCPREDVPERIKECHVVVPRMTRLTPEIISGARQLRLIVQFGVGLEGVDVPAATELGVLVARIPSAATGNAVSCAEHCIYLLLGLLRCQKEMANSVLQHKLSQPLGQTLQGRTVLITGYGAIGRELATRLRAFGVRVIGVRRSWNGTLASDANGAGVHGEVPFPLHIAAGMDKLPQLLPQADAVVACNHLSDETRGLVNAEFLQHCKKGVHVVNIARGGILDYGAVCNALQQGLIGGLGLDVTWHEPFDPNDPLNAHPNVIITPHVGGVTDVSYRAMATIIKDTILNLRDGRPLDQVEVVNSSELVKARLTL